MLLVYLIEENETLMSYDYELPTTHTSFLNREGKSGNKM